MGIQIEAPINRPLTSGSAEAAARPLGKDEKPPETSKYQLFVKAMTAKLKAEDPYCNQVPMLWQNLSSLLLFLARLALDQSRIRPLIVFDNGWSWVW
jgi:hypothetical protein